VVFVISSLPLAFSDISFKVDICSLTQRSLEKDRVEEQRARNCAIPDKLAPFVRYRRPGSEGDVALHGKRSKDRRIQKTMNLLHEALDSLIREKPYDEIVVQEILDRANVGRSTFYMHFRDKDDLLVSGIHDMLGSVHEPIEKPSSEKQYEGIIRFSLPVFEHIYQHRHTGAAMMGSRGRAIIHERLQNVVAKQIADSVKKHSQGRRKAAGPIPPDLLVHYVASTFILVLNWWVESRSPLPPKEVNTLFRALIQPTLESALQ
jgi:AcrR family transcriptional regulator